MKTLIRVTNKFLGNFDYKISKLKNNSEDIFKNEFQKNSRSIYYSHFNQTIEDINFLMEKYSEPVFGKMYVFDLLKELANCIDPTDSVLCCVSQLVHTMQVVEAMEQDNVKDEDMLIAGLIHDLGKLLLLTNEKPENIVCINTLVKKPADRGIGLDNCIFQWNHDEFVYDRFKDHVSYEVAWIVRYHSIKVKPNRIYMNNKDKKLAQKYLIPFKKYDINSKSIYNLPKKNLNDYKDLVYKYFPKPIIF